MSVISITLTLDAANKRNLDGIVEQLREVVAKNSNSVLFIDDSQWADGVPFYEVNEKIHIKSMEGEVG